MTNGLAVVLTVLLLPGLVFDGYYVGYFVVTGLVFGLLNAFVKPLIQFFLLRYLVVSYGIVVIAINAFLLYLLSAILRDDFTASSVLALLAGGLVVGVLGLIFDAVAGTTPPILDRQPEREEAS